MFWENPAVVGLILALPATALGYLGYRRSLPLDKAVTKTANNEGHIGLISALQADNQDLREELRALRGEHATEIRALREGLALVQARLEVVEAENARLERELAKVSSSGH